MNRLSVRRRTASTRVALLGTAILMSACLSRPVFFPPCADGLSEPCEGPGPRVLFVGNSLTYLNDVPSMVRALAVASGKTMRVAQVAYPDFSLDDHIGQGSARSAISSGQFDFVVLQQGPSSLPENRRLLANAVQRFAPLIVAAGGKPVLYEVWPQSTRRGDAPNVRLSYDSAATTISASVAHAGSAWTLLLQREPGLPLYATDGLHGSPLGSSVAAVALAARLLDVDPTSLAPLLPGISVDSVLARKVQHAVKDAATAVPQ